MQLEDQNLQGRQILPVKTGSTGLAGDQFFITNGQHVLSR